MRVWGLLSAAAAIACACAPALAIEGSSTAGPIGGTDIRSAQLPPPGVYGGLIGFHAYAKQFADGNGNTIPAFDALDLQRWRAGAFLLYVPDIQVFGGSVGIGAMVPAGIDCGHVFASMPKRCISGIGDPYIEVNWSRFFGTVRPSRYPGAYPIAEGLTVALGFGAVIPAGRYDALDAAQGLTVGNNLWVFAPTAAFTYMTKPILAEGTEFSARVYWNNYLTNPATQYSTGSLVNVDFAITERIGRFQLGFAGFYAFQIADDKLFGVTLPPDGRRAEVLNLGGVLAYDMPEYGASLKIKALTFVLSRNNVADSSGVVVGWFQKL